VVSVQYRLAPEFPFPAALQDAYAGLSWLFENTEELGVNPASIIVMGESAGGGLAAMLALLARDRGKCALRGQVLIYPMLDPRTGTNEAPTCNPKTGEFVWTVQHNRFAWSALRGETPIDAEWAPYFAPAVAPELAALPSTFIAVGAPDCFSRRMWRMRSVCRAPASPSKLTCTRAVFTALILCRAKWHLNTALIWHQPLSECWRPRQGIRDVYRETLSKARTIWRAIT